jgi:hypothetical protein
VVKDGQWIRPPKEPTTAGELAEHLTNRRQGDLRTPFRMLTPEKTR